ncbi:MAG TPA: hypothetical protein VLJ16_10585, partial [Acidobacteriota bacterium]|nr:hypothetical protein [Acidobacteriota bacterium]
MRPLRQRLVAFSLAVWVLALPAGLSAKDKRGSDLVVTRLDGSQVRGELIAVRRDSILILSAAGRDESLDLAAIRTVRVVRNAKAGKRALTGFLVGALCGAGLGLAADTDNSIFGTRFGAVAFCGGFLGITAGLATWGIAA